MAPALQRCPRTLQITTLPSGDHVYKLYVRDTGKLWRIIHGIVFNKTKKSAAWAW